MECTGGPCRPDLLAPVQHPLGGPPTTRWHGGGLGSGVSVFTLRVPGPPPPRGSV